MSELPKLTREGKTYYFDAKLNQLRNIDNPHDAIELDAAATYQIQQQIERRQARVKVIVDKQAVWFQTETPKCPKCSDALIGLFFMGDTSQPPDFLVCKSCETAYDQTR